MLYKELIEMLKTVKSEKDITVDITEMLRDVTIHANIELNRKQHKIKDSKQLFNISRMVVLNHFDNHLLTISEVE